ncbi:GNAT family N-acetyltransferase [Oscillospiraceae bacterium PP1C4]
MKFDLIKLSIAPELKGVMATWFHEKWGIPTEAYCDSMNECLANRLGVPQWYAVMDQDKIIAGLGIIQNDFHDRKDLSPNVCAVYVEKEYRGQGIAGEMLKFVCSDMKSQGIDTLYLITDHTSFYERYGWEFLCMVQGDGEQDMIQMYIHRL